jgi:hypothetical protein
MFGDTYSDFSKPVLAKMPNTVNMIYSNADWERMHGASYEQVRGGQTGPDPVIQEMYTRALAQKTGKSSVYNMQAPRSGGMAKGPVARPVPVQPQPQGSKKVVAALASWCGYSTKAASAHKAKNVSGQIQELWCDKQDKDHPLCKKTRGFPTYYSQDGKVLHSGYTPTPEKLV